MLKSMHPGDHLLVLAVEGELPPRRQSRVDAHLASCEACRRRVALMQATLSDVQRLYRSRADADVDARLRLQRALRRATEDGPRSRFATARRAIERWPGTVAVAGGALFVGLFVLWMGGSDTRFLPAQSLARSGALPVAVLTPGDVSSLSAAELCRGARPSRIVTHAVRHDVLAQYGMEGVSPDTYELDALITPELGGTTAPGNLWPQRYGSPSWNAYVKDALEQLLAQRVCDGEIPLEQAQRDIASDWVAAYKRYFRTDAPLAIHAEAAEPDDDLVFEDPPGGGEAVELVADGRVTRF